LRKAVFPRRNKSEKEKRGLRNATENGQLWKMKRIGGRERHRPEGGVTSEEGNPGRKGAYLETTNRKGKIVAWGKASASRGEKRKKGQPFCKKARGKKLLRGRGEGAKPGEKASQWIELKKRRGLFLKGRGLKIGMVGRKKVGKIFKSRTSRVQGAMGGAGARCTEGGGGGAFEEKRLSFGKETTPVRKRNSLAEKGAEKRKKAHSKGKRSTQR